MAKIKPRERPQTASGITSALKTECGKLLITLNYDKEKDEIIEVICRMSRTGNCQAAFWEVISKLLTSALRADVDEKDLFDHFQGVRCPAYIGNGVDNKPITSCLDGFIKEVERLIDVQKNAKN